MSAEDERGQSYMRGWRDGATATAKRKTFLEHPRDDLREAYEAGHLDGFNARAQATTRAVYTYGWNRSPLRGEAGGER